MISSHGTDIPPQNPSSAPPNVVEAPSTLRPRSIAELADIAKESLGDDARPFKTWLRIAENARRDAKSFHEQGDVESAFIEYARAATIILEKIPVHPDYRVVLSTTQRHNMGLHGQEILDGLADVKVSIMIRYEQWRANPAPVQVQSQPIPLSNSAPQALVPHRRSRMPSSYNQSPPEGDRAPRKRVDVIPHDMPPRREGPYSADGAPSEELLVPEDDMHRRREREEQGRRVTDQRRQEQDDILRRQQEAEYVVQALAMRNGTLATSAPALAGPINAYMQRPLESPTRYDEQWQTNHSSVQAQSQYSPASNSSPQPSLLRRSVYSDEANTLSPFSTRSSPWIYSSIRSWSRELPSYDQSPHHHGQSSQPSIADLPRIAEESGTISTLSSLTGTGTVSLESSSTSTSTSTVVAENPPRHESWSPVFPSPPSPPPLPLPLPQPPSALAETSQPFIVPSPYIPPPPSSSNPLPTRLQERRDPGISLPPPQMPKPPQGTYRRTVRYGFWNRRGDYLTIDGYIVYAPQERAFPPDLEDYPAPTVGYLDHHGNFIKYEPTRGELPESLPRQGQPPLLPYDKFVTFVYL